MTIRTDGCFYAINRHNGTGERFTINHDMRVIDAKAINGRNNFQIWGKGHGTRLGVDVAAEQKDKTKKTGSSDDARRDNERGCAKLYGTR